MIQRKKLYGLDILRSMSVLIVFLFHANMHCGCTFGKLTKFISQGAIFMDAFFLLSGFVLYYNYFDKCENVHDILIFYKKRFLSIYPLYVVLMLLYAVVHYHDLSLQKQVLLAPIEIFLLQSHFSSIFNVAHNGGTWFVSCIAFCYFLFPLLLVISRLLHKKKLQIALLFLLYCICAIAPIVTIVFQTNVVYDSPFFRMLEFFMVMILAQFFMRKDKTVKQSNFRIIFLSLGCALLLVATITMFVKIGFLHFLHYSFLSIPLFCVVIYALALLDMERIKLFSSVFMQCVNKSYYAFFLAQHFTFDLYRFINKHYGWSPGNKMSILELFSICLMVTIIFNLIEISVKKLLNKVVF